ncbi:glycosyltransferase family 2 protein [Succiniclasticum ruminis]|uniref:UDP-glucose:(Glucosyl)LPS beta-1,3-glucosyltransferase n=1 Tax=Succiniclasticum ruminis DSM 9236 TaxID=1123323 RepID=A0A1I2A910_9FIRM|nr:glycosyltransferase family 2 protein [Succiniclasticum ruminis]SFE40352.1 UDP-glucose:(glucosyl)LPS beta-1,3-glucosyltransferase [Succiniclasticum ruminis DSM 9236]
MNLQTKTYPLVSVVVPAYNTETRIAYSLESIIAQDYPNIEIIVVNDASTDGTENAARRILENCGRPFTIITHKKNRGETASRNTGMDAMKGEFLWFIDADDMAEPNLISSLYALIEKYQCKISFCGIKDRFTDGRPDVLIPVKIKNTDICNGEDAIWLRAFGEDAPPVCGILFRKTFLQETGLRFYEGCTGGGDIEFLLKTLCRAGRSAFTPDCLYTYVHHAEMGSVRDSNTKEKQIRRYRDNTGAHFRAAQYLSEYAPSERVKDLADSFFMPQAFIRQLTLCAKTNNRAEFDAILSDGATRKALSASKKYFFKKPEVYLKAFALLHFPDIYYNRRRG